QRGQLRVAARRPDAHRVDDPGPVGHLLRQKTKKLQVPPGRGNQLHLAVPVVGDARGD
ncbi:unnamed protein product, partial [Scytosiphon promiscuus]